MKITAFMAVHRKAIKRLRRAATAIFAAACAFFALCSGAPLEHALLRCLASGTCLYLALHCIDRAIGILAPIKIDLTQIKGIEVHSETGCLFIENEKFLITATEDEGEHIVAFRLNEKATRGGLTLESNYRSLTGESCLLCDGRTQYRLDGGLAKHLLAILNCHTETMQACCGLSFIP